MDQSTSQRALLALSADLEARHRHLLGHGRRVGDLSARLARRLGDAPALVAALRLAGRLHDVGKVVIPDGVLDKPGPLTAEELARVRTHPTAGWELCRRLPFEAPVLAAILHHHERFDGSGYPGGLAGEQIPWAARVLALADAFDALTTARAYRPAFSAREAMALLRGEHSAGRWDPRVFAALETVVAVGP